MFAYRDSRGRVDVAFTDRHGGASGGRFASLNLADPGADAAVGANLALVTETFTGGRSAMPARMRQVHGAQVVLVSGTDVGTSPEADALVTAEPGLPLMVRVADCVPVLLADLDAGPVAAVHAGRSGLVEGVVTNAVAVLRSAGARDLVGWVGPHVCGRCYEVPERMRAEVAAVVPVSHAQTSWGTPSLDLGAGVLAQLEDAGVATVDVARCTFEDRDLYSYRRDGHQAGRLAGLVWLRP